MASIFCLSILALTFSPNAKAQSRNKQTTVKFNQPIEIPGVGQQYLPAGTYIFKLVDSASDRHIVRILSEDQTHVFATILAIPNYRLQSTDKTVMTFSERAAGKPEAIRAWFYPGANWGEEFVYPKTRAVELAKLTNEPVLSMPTELASTIVAPVKSVTEEPAAALVEAPLKAVKPTGEEVEVAVAVEPAAKAIESTPVEPEEDETLPETASSLPLLGLIGLLSLGAGFAFWVFPKRAA
jgi:hypothetical protein